MPDFADVDGAERPLALVDILDAFNAVPAVAAYKQRALELLSLRPGQKALDVGSGTGGDAALVARRLGAGGLAVGVDRSATMAREARRRQAPGPAGPSFVRADGRALPFAGQSFDACRIDRVLHTLEDPLELLREAVRVTRPGGRLVVSEPDWGTLALSPADHPLTQRLERVFHEGGRRALLGRHLGELLERMGVRDVEVHAFTGVVTRFEQARHLSALDAVLAAVEPELTRDWLREMERADAEGRFRATLGGVTAAGDAPRRP